MQELKHDPEEAEKMCSLVEEYAKEKVIQEAIESAVEFDRPKEETIARLIKKYGLTKEKTQEYYDIFAK